MKLRVTSLPLGGEVMEKRVKGPGCAVQTHENVPISRRNPIITSTVWIYEILSNLQLYYNMYLTSLSI